ncbi:MAG: VapC toxin family PIN domain ribonuclease, partial [Saprospiraceae bacterium]|nr:VapC toxin family PIN domain ribonuclease [Saprospiraceae bacterium]
MILVDSTVWIDFFNGVTSRETDLLDLKLTTERIGIGDIILSEVLRGFKDDKGFEKAKNYLLSLPCFDLCGKTIAL